MVKSCDPNRLGTTVTMEILDKWLYEMTQKQTALDKKFTEQIENEKLQERIKKLEDENSSLKQKVNDLEKKVSENGPINQSSGTDSWANVVSNSAKKTDNQINLLLATAKETKEQNEKEKNLVIFGIKLSNKTEINDKKADDLTELNKLLDEINFNKNKVKRSYRLKSKNEKPGAIIVELNNVIERNEALKAAKSLKNSNEYKSVYINPDLTESQRAQFKRLLSEKKQKNEANVDENFYYVIRNDRVIRINTRL